MLAYLFVIFAAAIHIRFIALPFSFTPVVAALLYFGARMPRKQMWIPVALLAASDVYLTRVTYGYPITADHFVTFAWYAAIILLGSVLIKGFSPLRIGASALIGSSLVFCDQQLCRLDGLARHVSQDVQRADDLLRCRLAILPQRGCLRSALHCGVLWYWILGEPEELGRVDCRRR